MQNEYRVRRDGRVSRLDHDEHRTESQASGAAWSFGQTGMLHGWRAMVAHLMWLRPGTHALAH